MSLIQCSECGKEDVSEFADMCLTCGCPIGNITKETDVDNQACILLDTYTSYGRPLYTITAYGLIILLISLVFLIPLFTIKGLLNFDDNYPEWVFLIYTCVFAAFWFSYFTSKKPKFERCDSFPPLQSLRCLLGETGTHWSADNKPNTQLNKQLIDSYRRKSNSSMQVLAILIAVSTLIIARITSIYDDAIQFPKVINNLDLFFLIISGLAAIVSFICFVVSVDALDVVFNKFKSTKAGHIVIEHYYQSTINPKYIGLVSMLVSIIFLSAYYHPYIGCFTIGATLFLGYYHWFPDINVTIGHSNDRLWKTLVLLMIAVLPLLFWGYDKLF